MDPGEVGVPVVGDCAPGLDEGDPAGVGVVTGVPDPDGEGEVGVPGNGEVGEPAGTGVVTGVSDPDGDGELGVPDGGDGKIGVPDDGDGELGVPDGGEPEGDLAPGYGEPGE